MSAITVDDFDLSPEEMKDLVEGAQKFLAPAEDPEDNDRPITSNDSDS